MNEGVVWMDVDLMVMWGKFFIFVDEVIYCRGVVVVGDFCCWYMFWRMVIVLLVMFEWLCCGFVGFVF